MDNQPYKGVLYAIQLIIKASLVGTLGNRLIKSFYCYIDFILTYYQRRHKSDSQAILHHE